MYNLRLDQIIFLNLNSVTGMFPLTFQHYPNGHSANPLLDPTPITL